MPTSLSLYLDLVRFLAALAVFVTHLNDKAVIGSPVSWWSGSYGSVAVVIFFVLSGYVISHVVEVKEKTAEAYFGSRLSRIYSVVLVALAVTVLCDSLGMAINPEFYKVNKVITTPGWAGYLATLTLVNEFQIFHWGGIAAGTNSPLWSLSFEATFYLAAGLALFLKSRLRFLAILILFACAGRTIAALAPLWLLGFLLHRFRRSVQVNSRLAGLVFALTLIAFFAWPKDLEEFGLTSTKLVWLPWDAWQFNRNIFADYFCAATFAINIVCAQKLAQSVGTWMARAAVPIRWLGSLTFPLYCLHKPVTYFLSAVSPFPPGSWLQPVFVTTCVFAVVVLITPVCDWIKDWMRGALAHPRVSLLWQNT